MTEQHNRHIEFFDDIEQAVLLVFFAAYHDAALPFSEQERVQADVIVGNHVEPKAIRHGHLKQAHKQAAIGHVVGGANAAPFDGLPHAALNLAFGFQIEVRSRRPVDPCNASEVFGSIDAIGDFAEQENEFSLLFEIERHVVGAVLNDTHHANGWSREDGHG